MDQTVFQNLRHQSVGDLRLVIREGSYTGHTAGLGAGMLQANLVILPQDYALDFMRFCQRNPKPCPLVGVSDTGDAMMRTLGRDIDIRTDVPAYNIYRDGKLSAETMDISDLWRDDLVSFALGCSFTFEHAAIAAGIQLWHIDNNTTVPMFRTNILTVPAGPFEGPLVVSMRAIPEDQVDLAVEISRKFPLAHGAPIHIGDPAEIGVADVTRPDWGDPAPVPEGSVPVFWACGVTPQVALEAAKAPLCITHKPGHMLVTDVPQDAENPVLRPST
ncbi:putative hydro-lyase [Palleronia caenipelagi]|uniref:Putative hydro-lyase FEV53_17235 n=1 Tax=Palleronia caenipelagi TaxID=2489174 RepID=A0A547PM97_9RHOB|nr:putative hydro-lyase [Palleronia caenipelagi]TRD15265.1 putative hydro-lyase [Palleronia caenipelagi]